MISIIIPTREEEKAIGKTLAHLKANIKMPFELIVSDGGSVDNTREEAAKHTDKVLRFGGVQHNPAIGRNDGAAVAIHTYLVFLDADTHIENPEEFFTRALAHFDADPNLVGVTGPQWAHPHLETWADRISFGILNTALYFNNNVFGKGEASGKFMIVRHEAFKAINGFRNDLVTREDGDFFNRLSRIGRTYYDPTLHVYHGARRAHTYGWLKLWYIWIKNTLHVALFDTAAAKDWTPVR
jgi:glycosyltransferase involved in cell wall biosynthesis